MTGYKVPMRRALRAMIEAPSFVFHSGTQIFKMVMSLLTNTASTATFFFDLPLRKFSAAEESKKTGKLLTLCPSRCFLPAE